MMSDFEKLAERIKANNPVNPIFKDRNRDTKTKFLSDKKTEELRKKFKDNVENIKRRHDWLEASKRHNYIMEYDRLKGEYNTILNKDPNATSINLLKDRMDKLKKLADISVNGIKHEIYAKDSTGEHITSGTAPTAPAAPAAPAAPVVVQGEPLDTRLIRNTWYCDACNVTIPENQKASHCKSKLHKDNEIIRRTNAEQQLTRAQTLLDRVRMNHAATIMENTLRNAAANRRR